MDQTRHTRLSRHAGAVALTATAHERLLRYLADARTALAADPDADETMRDLEATLGEQTPRQVRATDAPLDDAQMAELLSAAGAVPGLQPVGDARGLPMPGWTDLEPGR